MLKALAGRLGRPRQSSLRQANENGSLGEDARTDQDAPVSDAPEILANDAGLNAYQGWHQAGVAAWQNNSYRSLLDQMYSGNVRLDLQVAADAIADTGLANPTILEVGCGSGYYSEVFSHLRNGASDYTGLDYSRAMIDLASIQYPQTRFVLGDAAAMDFADGTFDIVINGAALMHMPSYAQAIAESRRVSKTWCIFHTIPVVESRPTTVLKKRAYGEDVLEITFNESDLKGIFDRSGLVLHKTYANIPHDYLSKIMGEPVTAFTYLLRKA